MALWWETVCPTRWKTRRGGGGEGSRPPCNLSLPLVGAGNKGAALPPPPPSSSRPLFPCCDRGLGSRGADGAFLPSPVLAQLEETGGQEPALHSNNNRLPRRWGAGREPERPPHSTPPLAKHVFLFSDGEEGAGTHPEQTWELISPREARPPARSAEAGTGPGPPWRSLRPQSQVQS